MRTDSKSSTDPQRAPQATRDPSRFQLRAVTVYRSGISLGGSSCQLAFRGLQERTRTLQIKYRLNTLQVQREPYKLENHESAQHFCLGILCPFQNKELKFFTKRTLLGFRSKTKSSILYSISPLPSL